MKKDKSNSLPELSIESIVEEKVRLLDECTDFVRPILEPFARRISELLMEFTPTDPSLDLSLHAALTLSFIPQGEVIARKVGHYYEPLFSYLANSEYTGGLKLTHGHGMGGDPESLVLEVECAAWNKLIAKELASTLPLLTNVLVEFGTSDPSVSIDIEKLRFFDLADLRVVHNNMRLYWKNYSTWAVLTG